MESVSDTAANITSRHVNPAVGLIDRPVENRRETSVGGILSVIAPYAAIARPDHWFKNVFMALGLVLAYFCHPELFGIGAIWSICWAVATTCIVASSNYVLNEILDA